MVTFCHPECLPGFTLEIIKLVRQAVSKLSRRRYILLVVQVGPWRRIKVYRTFSSHPQFLQIQAGMERGLFEDLPPAFLS